MESAAGNTPLKVCRHCSAASRTDAESCPNCGRSYRRRLWRWWFAIPIVALAFAGGYLGRKALQDDEPAETAGFTIQEARSLDIGASPSKLDHVLDGQKPAKVRRQTAGGNELLCRYYVIVDQEDTLWEACLLNDRLEVSRPLKVSPD